MERSVYCCDKQGAVLYQRTEYWQCATQSEREEIIALGDMVRMKKKPKKPIKVMMNLNR